MPNENQAVCTSSTLLVTIQHEVRQATAVGARHHGRVREDDEAGGRLDQGRLDRGRLRAAIDAAPSLVDAMSSLVDHAFARVFAMPHAVTTAAEGRLLLVRDDGTEEMADRVQRVVVLAVPVVRTVARGARFTRVPWVLVASSAFSIGTTVRAGIHEVQVIGSLLAHRLEQATGRPADQELARRLALELYLSPRRSPSVEGRPLPIRRLLQRWLFRGALGRDTRKAAERALDAAERLELAPYLHRRDRPVG
jgi:hypothetical protein